MKEQTRSWLNDATGDLKVADSLFSLHHYRYAVFMCHLCLEKALKACIIEYTDVFPPHIHNLGRLAETARLELPAELAEFMFQISDESVHTRYPEYRKRYTRALAQGYLKQTKSVFSWLKQKLTSNE